MLSGPQVRTHQHAVDLSGTSYCEAQRPKCIAVPYRKLRTACKAAQRSQEEEVHFIPAGLRRGAIAAAAAVWLSAMPLSAVADVPMVSPSEVADSAKALAKQPVQKGKVWLLLAGGSAALFALTVALERSKVFPAIAKANEAMSVSKAAREGAAAADQQQQPLDVQPESSSWEEESASTDAVLQGLQSASRRVLDDKGTAAAFNSGGTADAKADEPAALAKSGDSTDGKSDGPAAAAKSEDIATMSANDSTTSRSSLPQDPAATSQSSGEAATGNASSSGAFVSEPPAAAQESPASATASDSRSERTEQPALQPAEGPLGSHSSAKQSSQQAVSDVGRSSQSDEPGTATSPEAPAAFEDAKRRDASDLPSKEAEADSAAPAAQPSQAPNETPSAVPLSEMSSEDLERLITARKQQQQQQQEERAAKARSREEPIKGAGKDLADLSEEELQSLIASKRKMAANVVKTVVDP